METAYNSQEGNVTSQPTTLHLELRTQELIQDDGGHNVWRAIARDVAWAPSETAIVICDMWDDHWSRGAAERVVAMIPHMNKVLRVARAAGIQIVHAPSETMDFYADSPARRRMRAIEPVDPPPEREHSDPPLPFDASDGGSDTGETPWFKAWTRQHPGIEIDADRDDNDFFLVFSALEKDQEFVVCAPPKGKSWYLALDSGQPSPEDFLIPGHERLLPVQNRYTVKARSVVVLISK